MFNIYSFIINIVVICCSSLIFLDFHVLFPEEQENVLKFLIFL